MKVILLQDVKALEKKVRQSMSAMAMQEILFCLKSLVWKRQHPMPMI